MKNIIVSILILAFGFCFSSSTIGQESVKNRKAYQDSLQNEWWFPFVEKQGIELMEYLDYCQSPETRNIFINGKLETKSDTLTIFKNGIAFQKLQEKYIVYYFDSFQIEPIDYELTCKKFEYYSIDSLLLLSTEQYKGGFYFMRTDKKNNSVIIQMIEKP